MGELFDRWLEESDPSEDECPPEVIAELEAEEAGAAGPPYRRAIDEADDPGLFRTFKTAGGREAEGPEDLEYPDDDGPDS